MTIGGFARSMAACGVTPQAVVMHSKPEFCITHAPGHMFVTDVKNTALKF